MQSLNLQSHPFLSNNFHDSFRDENYAVKWLHVLYLGNKRTLTIDFEILVLLSLILKEFSNTISHNIFSSAENSMDFSFSLYTLGLFLAITTFGPSQHGPNFPTSSDVTPVSLITRSPILKL